MIWRLGSNKMPTKIISILCLPDCGFSIFTPSSSDRILHTVNIEIVCLGSFKLEELSEDRVLPSLVAQNSQMAAPEQRFQSTLTINPNPTAVAVSSNPEGETSQMPKEDTSEFAMEDPMTTSDEEEYDYTLGRYEGDDDSSEDDMEVIEAAYKLVSTHPCIDLGQTIMQAFPNPVEYEDDEMRDIFDDGLEDDESESGSDASTNFEELSDPGVIFQVVPAASDPDDSESKGDASDLDSSDLEDSDEDAYRNTTEEEGEDGEEEDDDDEIVELPNPVESAQQASTLQGGSHVGSSHAPGTTESVAIPKKSFKELEAQRYELLHQKSEYGTWESLQQKAESSRWRLLELEEIQRHLEERLSDARLDVELTERERQEAEEQMSASLEHSGISQELYDAYSAFCESLSPEFGQREGVSATCYADHKNSYVGYDPEFNLFKACVEMPYDQYNFRCEAGLCPWNKRDYIVEFWPLAPLEPLLGAESTWGGHYPELYELAIAAVRAGSEAAMEMLVALPDMKSSYAGGWLFEYQFEEALSGDPIVGKRWRFGSAHKIDSPCTVEEKRERLKLILKSRTGH
ncbi:hypothetical protein PVAG01_03459 [Phlyctema vagabunda]|uniref:Uncharacterized protein n=1 Tax=Phlyctema vagabunda TaxID=108571 RepID=A0ABR4PLH0_9HELO